MVNVNEDPLQSSWLPYLRRYPLPASLYRWEARYLFPGSIRPAAKFYNKNVQLEGTHKIVNVSDIFSEDTIKTLEEKE